MTSVITAAALLINYWDSVKAQKPATESAEVDLPGLQSSLLTFWIAYSTLRLAEPVLNWIPFSDMFRTAILLSALTPNKQLCSWVHQAVSIKLVDTAETVCVQHSSTVHGAFESMLAWMIRNVCLPFIRACMQRLPESKLLPLADQIGAVAKELQTENTRRLQLSLTHINKSSEPQSAAKETAAVNKSAVSFNPDVRHFFSPKFI
jgi:hypothetical protein